eukprot:8548482-Prorocentrum_lima.AAC.1
MRKLARQRPGHSHTLSLLCLPPLQPLTHRRPGLPMEEAEEPALCLIAEGPVVAQAVLSVP